MAMTLTGIALTVIAVLLIPGLTLLWRGAVKWTRVEVKLDAVVKDLSKIVEDKDRTHAELAAQMREDRTATNSRLRWLEEHLWKNGVK
jgi:hypothetical protein